MPPPHVRGNAVRVGKSLRWETICITSQLEGWEISPCIAATGQISSAENVIDAAEAYASRVPGPDRRVALLRAVRLGAASTRSS
jgi:hypothetical protein